MSNLRDKNDRAVRAYIAAVIPAGMPIYISLDPETRDITEGPGLVDVQSGTGTESPRGTGNYTFQVRIRAIVPAVTQAGQQPNDNHAALGALVDALFDLLHLSDNGQDYAATARLITQAGNQLTVDQSGGTELAGMQSAKDNADMGAYSCLALTHETVAGDKLPTKQSGLNFVEVATFSMNAAGFGGYWT